MPMRLFGSRINEWNHDNIYSIYIKTDCLSGKIKLFTSTDNDTNASNVLNGIAYDQAQNLT